MKNTKKTKTPKTKEVKVKTCCTCKEIFPINLFYKDSAKKDGHASSCKECAKAYLRNRYTLKYPDYVYYGRENEYHLEYNREYVRNLSPELIEKKKTDAAKWARENRDKTREYQRQYHIQYRQKQKEKRQNEKAKTK